MRAGIYRQQNHELVAYEESSNDVLERLGTNVSNVRSIIVTSLFVCLFVCFFFLSGQRVCFLVGLF